jgi:hypothetical protein
VTWEAQAMLVGLVAAVVVPSSCYRN